MLLPELINFDQRTKSVYAFLVLRYFVLQIHYSIIPRLARHWSVIPPFCSSQSYCSPFAFAQKSKLVTHYLELRFFPTKAQNPVYHKTPFKRQENLLLEYPQLLFIINSLLSLVLKLSVILHSRLILNISIIIMIKGILIINNLGKPRLVKFYQSVVRN